MKAKIKSVDLNSQIGIADFRPEREDYFSVWLTFTIGTAGGEGGDSFRLNVCTPKWLQDKAPRWGRHLLIVDRYDLEWILASVESYISSIDESDWLAVAEKIARLLEWEFEDYEP